MSLMVFSSCLVSDPCFIRHLWGRSEFAVSGWRVAYAELAWVVLQYVPLSFPMVFVRFCSSLGCRLSLQKGTPRTLVCS